MRRIALWFAVVWALGLATLLLGVSITWHRSSSTVRNRSGDVVAHSESGPSLRVGAGLLAERGPRALVLLLPAAVAALPLLIRHPGRRRAAALGAAVLVGTFAAIGAASVGILLLPSVLALTVAASYPAAGIRPAT